MTNSQIMFLLELHLSGGNVQALQLDKKGDMHVKFLDADGTLHEQIRNADNTVFYAVTPQAG